MERWLDFGAAVFAIVAAVFWFLSAAGNVPSIMTYWGQAPALTDEGARLVHETLLGLADCPDISRDDGRIYRTLVECATRPIDEAELGFERSSSISRLIATAH
jgi:hypothetical protein